MKVIEKVIDKFSQKIPNVPAWSYLAVAVGAVKAPLITAAVCGVLPFILKQEQDETK